MKHLLISREYPPAAYPPGGIGTYALNIARLLAEAGETVHVIGERWRGAPLSREASCGGRLVVHRVAPEDATGEIDIARARRRTEIEALSRSRFPAQWFALQAALLAERLIEEEGVDVIEGQEWEAPLYYLLLRRAIGLGPRRRPPCVVHLHSPTELIARFNGWDVARPEFLTMKRMEDYCIRAADALLCPSEFLARQCEARYRLPGGSIQVIRLPAGGTRFVARDPGAWARGSICYVGRLEPRKGVIEWVDAAVLAAPAAPGVAFDFIGADMPARPFDSGVSMRACLEARIPPALRRRFRFHGSVPREQLPRFLARAQAAAVPSRWENFPNACIEAMRSGLPVIATRLGGMAEMVEDGVSGWLADGDDVVSMVPGLTKALQRCLESTPQQRQAMGAAAASTIRRLCDNRRTTEAHLAFKARVARIGSIRSARVPGARAVAPDDGHRQGIGVVAWIASAADGGALLDSLARQRRAPAVLIIAGRQGSPALPASAGGGKFLLVNTARPGVAWNAAFAEASAAAAPIGWLFLDHNDRLQPDALERLEMAFTQAPELGAISCWTGFDAGAGRLRLAPNPELPHQWLFNDAVRATAFRAAAIPLAAPFGTDPGRGTELWELTLSVLIDGWAAVTYPAMLATRAGDDLGLQWPESVAFRERRAELVQQHAAALTRHVPALIDLYVPPPVEPLVLPAAPRRRVVVLLRRLMRLIRRPQRLREAALRRLAAGIQVVFPGEKETP